MNLQMKFFLAEHSWWVTCSNTIAVLNINIVVPHQPGIRVRGMRKPENKFLHLSGPMQRTAYLAVPRLQQLLWQHRGYWQPNTCN